MLSHGPAMSRARILYSLWLLCLVALLALHYVHLRADFPNFSPWMDYSKYTDEGWYANAAIRHYVNGSWYLRGDFNPAVALPVWPLLVAGVFHFTGVSLSAARAVAVSIFAANLCLAFFLVRTREKLWTALLAITLLLSSAFLFAFSRLAILEPLLIFFLLSSWLAVLRLPASDRPRRRLAALVFAGVCLCLMVLTKTTAIFLIPSTFFLIWNAYGYKWRASLQAGSIVVLSAAVPWSLYYFLLVRPHYRIDYNYLFESNKWPQPTTLSGWLASFWYALHGSLWISPSLCITASVLLLLSFFFVRSLWRNPLLIASLLAAGGYIFFAGWHDSPQPRYYEVVVYSLSFALVLSVAELFRSQRGALLARIAASAGLAVVVFHCLLGTRQIAGDLLHPEYGMVRAAEGITRYIDQHPARSRLLLSISGDDITLITHLPAICDDFGTWDLPYRMHTYQPGWFAEWNDIDPGTLVDLQTQYSLQQVASFPAFDDEDRNLLILYKLNPLPPAQQTYKADEEAQDNAGR
jgi:4-amino-4-deoxy-L-arabinose transferase-like glycosyltransferase